MFDCDMSAASQTRLMTHRARRLGACGTDLDTDIRSRDEDLGDRDTVTVNRSEIGTTCL
jgi:hypothetical protein